MSVLKHIDEVIEVAVIFCVSESYWAGLVTVRYYSDQQIQSSGFKMLLEARVE